MVCAPQELNGSIAALNACFSHMCDVTWGMQMAGGDGTGGEDWDLWIDAVHKGFVGTMKNFYDQNPSKSHTVSWYERVPTGNFVVHSTYSMFQGQRLIIITTDAEVAYIKRSITLNNSPSLIFGFGAEFTLSFFGKDGHTGSAGQLTSLNTGTYNFGTHGSAKGIEASAGLFMTFIKPISSSFSLNDISGTSYGINFNLAYGVGFSLFTNNNLSYIGVSVSIGPGFGGSYTNTTTQMNKVDDEILNMQNDLWFRYAPH